MTFPAVPIECAGLNDLPVLQPEDCRPGTLVAYVGTFRHTTQCILILSEMTCWTDGTYRADALWATAPSHRIIALFPDSNQFVLLAPGPEREDER